MHSRSYHFIPANKPALFHRVNRLGADAYVFDIEDAVPGKEKAEALLQVERWFNQLSTGFNKFYLRVNGCEHPVADHEARLTRFFPYLGIVLPKVETAEELCHAANFYGIGKNRRIMGLIESPLALRNLDSILETGLLSSVGLGIEDFLSGSIYSALQVSGLVGTVRTQLALAAMAKGIEAIDTVSLDLSGGEGLRADAELARSAGCTGKFSIHPNQISVINSTFSPDKSVIANAREMESLLNYLPEESGYIRVGETLLSPPKIKKLKHILQFSDHYDC